MTNSWVLTASSCVDWDLEPSQVTVEYGGAAAALEQVETAVEMYRHPDNRKLSDQTVRRGRDAMLLKLAHPIVVGGQTSGFHRAYFGWPTSHLIAYFGGKVSCVGWSLSPQYESTPTLLRQVDFSIDEVLPDASSDGLPVGDQIWFKNSYPTDPGHGWIQTPVDRGSGCFVLVADAWQRASIHVGNPTQTRTGESNDYQEAWSLGLGDASTREFIERTLFGVDDQEGFEAGSPILRANQPDESLGAYWISTDGALLRRTKQGAWSSPATNLGQPPNRSLESEAPGVLGLPSGRTKVWVRDTTGQLWTREASQDIWGEWTTLSSPVLASAVSAAAWGEDVFNLFALAPDAAVLYAQVDAAWDGTWRDLGHEFGFYLVTPPIATSWGVGRFDVFGRDQASCFGHFTHWDANPEGVGCDYPGVSSVPAATTWDLASIPSRFDRFFIGPSGTLMHHWGQGINLDVPIDTNIRPLGDNLHAVARRPGTLDLISRDGGNVRHVYYPR